MSEREHIDLEHMRIGDSCKHCLSDDDARKIARAVVHETLLTLGADTNNPLDLQADFKFLRAMRTTHEKIGLKVLISIIGLFISATAALVVIGFVAWIRKG